MMGFGGEQRISTSWEPQAKINTSLCGLWCSVREVHKVTQRPKRLSNSEMKQKKKHF